MAPLVSHGVATYRYIVCYSAATWRVNMQYIQDQYNQYITIIFVKTKDKIHIPVLCLHIIMQDRQIKGNINKINAGLWKGRMLNVLVLIFKLSLFGGLSCSKSSGEKTRQTTYGFYSFI